VSQWIYVMDLDVITSVALLFGGIETVRDVRLDILYKYF